MLRNRPPSYLLLGCVALLGCLFSIRCRADEPTGPCTSEWKQFVSSMDKPDSDSARQAWDECRKRANEEKKKSLADTATAWARGLDPLLAGGWELLSVSPDGTLAVFGSHRHGTRKGSVVAVWLRFEYREGKSIDGVSYKSVVERDLYDCGRVASKGVSATYYFENNLQSPGPSNVYEEGKIAWDPAIPGTLGDSLLSWACRTTPGAQPAKAK